MSSEPLWEVDTLEFLRTNPYPGRVLIVGKGIDAPVLVVATAIMGRSPSSRNRVYEATSDSVHTAPADPSQPSGNPDLTLYSTMRLGRGYGVVSNGHQTDRVVTAERSGASLSAALEPFSFEPDAPNFTPRITGVVRTEGKPTAEIAILKRDRLGGRVLQLFKYDQLAHSQGHCVHTYDGDGDPLPSFTGEPREVEIMANSAAVIAATLWDVLNPENRVAVAVATYDLDRGHWSLPSIINQYGRVPSVS